MHLLEGLCTPNGESLSAPGRSSTSLRRSGKLRASHQIRLSIRSSSRYSSYTSSAIGMVRSYLSSLTANSSGPRSSQPSRFNLSQQVLLSSVQIVPFYVIYMNRGSLRIASRKFPVYED